MKEKLGRAAQLLLIGVAMLTLVLMIRQGDLNELRAVVSEQGDSQVKVIAHRGGAASAPENTLAALEHAIEMGADLAEVDLRMTKDGVLIALHDESLKRTTGVDQLVSGLDIRAVRELDAGDWFSPDFEGERIPTLTELLGVARGRIRLMLELKHTQSDQKLVESAVEQIRSMGMEKECVLASSNLELLRISKELLPELETVYLGEETSPEIWGLAYIDGYSISLPALTVQDVRQAHEMGRELYVWTVNDRWEMERALLMGADGLVTDDLVLGLEMCRSVFR